MQFDPNAFMNVEIDQPLVRRPPLPPQDYVATIGAVKAEQWMKKDDTQKTGMRYVVPLILEVPPEVQNKLGTPDDPYPPTVKLSDSIMLDLTEGGTLDLSVGKNSGLRRWRDALDMNKKGEVFSPRKMEGRMVLVKIGHDIYQGEVQERIAGVAKV